MPKTTSWERHVRRREVIRLRFEERVSTSAIADRLGCSEPTVRRDLQEIGEKTAALGEPEVIRKQLLFAVGDLLEHEFTDLRDAHRAGDFEAKHRAKASFRDTLELVIEVYERIEDASGIEHFSPEAQEVLLEAAEREVEGLLAPETRQDGL